MCANAVGASPPVTFMGSASLNAAHPLPGEAPGAVETERVGAIYLSDVSLAVVTPVLLLLQLSLQNTVAMADQHRTRRLSGSGWAARPFRFSPALDGRETPGMYWFIYSFHN